MYSIIIVDDEQVIRNGLAEVVDWNSLGFELSGTFEDGKDAIRFIKDNKVDVLLTDIRMAEVSGIELAEFVYREFPRINVVIVSGYKEFEYAKRAMEFNVRHYLLKPTKVVEIRKVLAIIKEELDRKQQEEKDIRDERDRYYELVAFLREQFFMDLVMGALRVPAELERRLEVIDHEIDPGKNPCCIIHAAIKDYDKYLEQSWEYGRTGLDMALKNFFHQYNSKVSFNVVPSTGCELKLVAIVMQTGGQEDLKSAINEHMCHIKHSAEEILGIEIEFSIENSFKNLFELSNYNQPFTGNYEVPAYEAEIESRGLSGNTKILVDKLKMIVSNICEGNIGHVDSLLDSLMESLKNTPFKQTQSLMIDLFELLIDNLAALGIKTSMVDYRSILFMEGTEEIKSYCEKTLLDIAKQINDRERNSSISQLVEKAKEYILCNYQKDLSLENVADKVFLNPVYLSRMFKQVTGENFTDYLTDVRMQKAIELMAKRMYKMHEIGEKVGYNSNRYFMMVFKKYTGYTPKEYCRKVLGER